VIVPNPVGTPLEVLERLAAAVVAGGVLGFNRELRQKPAGLRTHALVALGAAGATTTAMALAAANGGVDANAVSRVVQGVLTGIGFIGGGVILRDVQAQSVRGLTTAASIWVATTLGVACGAGAWVSVLGVVGLGILTLVVGGRLEQGMHRLLGTAPEPEPEAGSRGTPSDLVE
jgi:putative Mg2+ transporter-C (MgtC) family protein